jgi:hypothetical protein
MEHLVTAREFEAAKLLNDRFGRKANGVADREFADPGAHYPFGWSLVSNGSLGAERALIGSAPALAYRASPANSGQVAAQLLVLPPGRYALATKTAAAASGAAPYWSLICGNAGGAQIGRLDQPMTANATAVTMFTVAPDCTGQWLTLSVRPAPDSSAQSGAVAWVSVSPR